MARYIEFTTDEKSVLLIEIDKKEELSPGGIKEAGLVGDMLEKTVVSAQTLFEKAVDNMIRYNAKAFLQAIRSLPQQDQPESMEVSFALKATGEIGNAAIAKGTGEGNYIIKLTWKRSS